MEVVILIIGLVLFLFAGTIIAMKNNGEIKQLLQKNKQLAQRVDILNQQLDDLQKKWLSSQTHAEPYSPGMTTPATKESNSVPETVSVSPKIAAKAVASETTDASRKAPVQTPNQHDNSVASAKPPTPTKTSPSSQHQNKSFDIENLLKGNGLLWLGGIVLALGGIFLAKYAIEANLVSPEIRVLMGGVFGILLIGAAEFLNRNKVQFKIHSPYIIAAIASGGIITCFAMTQVAFDYYHFISAQTAFVLLAVIALLCISLALRYGPLLAGIGIIGAYAVPALVSTGSNNIFALLIYVSFVSGSAIWVANRVQQNWLWWQSFVGHFIWLAAAVALSDQHDFAIVLFTCLLSIYYYVALDILGWKLQRHHTAPLPLKTLLMPRKEQLGVLLPVILLAGFLVSHPASSSIVTANLLLTAFLCLLAWRHSAFDSWPFIGLAFALFSFTLFGPPESFDDNMFPFTGAWLFIQVSVLLGLAYSVLAIKHFPTRHSYLFLLVLTPLSLFGLSYALSPPQAEGILYPLWVIELLLIAVASTFWATKSQPIMHKVSYLLLSNGCLSLCLTMLLDASTLTLALVMQVASMSFLTRKYLVALPDWLYKVALTLVTIRLTAAPWLDSYTNETILGVHWTLIIYPLVIGLIWFARQYNQSDDLKAWFTGVMVHVTALFVTTETAWLMSGHYPDFHNMSFEETTILSLNWLILGAAYLFRRQFVNRLKNLYEIAGYGLITMALLSHFKISFTHSPYFNDVSVGTGLVNWLLPLWALPAVMFTLLRYLNLLHYSLHKMASVFTGVFMFFYINGLIRTQFHAGSIQLSLTTPQSELYTYSIVWLVLSVICIFAAQYWQKTSLRHVGFSLLAMVVLKAFIVDMANLDGLYRALSFIGLGLSLVAIGWLYQKMQVAPVQPNEQRQLG